MADPREEKLPKWAQDLLTHERVKNALCFPNEADPEPDYTATNVGSWQGRKPVEGQCIFLSNKSGIYARYVDAHGYLYRDEKMTGFGSRPEGPHFECVENARLSRRWIIARAAATKLYHAQTAKVRE